jgi:hypothetical protein
MHAGFQFRGPSELNYQASVQRLAAQLAARRD